MTAYLMKTTFTFILILFTHHIYSRDIYVWAKLESKPVKAQILNEQKDNNQEDTSTLNREAEIIVFSAEEENGEVSLNWQTSFETNNDYFTIERSIDISTWENIGSLPGAGNSNNLSTYNFIDQSPINGISYYRIKHTDYNGVVTYSKVVAIETQGSSSRIKLFPQPSSSYVQINLDDYKNENLVISILNSRGIVLKRLTSATSSTYIDVSDLNYGIYFIRVESNKERPQMVKLVKN